MAEITSALTASGYKSLCVYNDRLELLGRIESWLSLVWPERYNVYSNVQGAQLELHDTTALQALCRPDRYLWLVGSDRLMRIVSAQKADHKLVLYTKDAACILDERVSTGTLSSFAVEDTLRGLVSGAAAWPCLELGDPAGLADAYAGEVKPGSLLSIAEQVCQELDIGFRVRFDQQQNKLLFELYRPKLDPNARYAPQYGNLTDLAYTESITDYKNICTVVGADGTVTVGATDNTGTARREMLLDASSKKKEDGQSQSEYLAALRTLGEQELAKHTRLENFEFTPTGPVTVGKVVAASLPGTDIQAAARITSVTLKIRSVPRSAPPSSGGKTHEHHYLSAGRRDLQCRRCSHLPVHPHVRRLRKGQQFRRQHHRHPADHHCPGPCLDQLRRLQRRVRLQPGGHGADRARRRQHPQPGGSCGAAV